MSRDSIIGWRGCAMPCCFSFGSKGRVRLFRMSFEVPNSIRVRVGPVIRVKTGYAELALTKKQAIKDLFRGEAWVFFHP